MTTGAFVIPRSEVTRNPYPCHTSLRRSLGFRFGCDRPFGQGFDDIHGFEADMDHLADEALDVLGIVLAVGVVDDAAALVGRDLVLIDDPLKGGAVAESVFVDLSGDVGEGPVFVVGE